MREPKDYEAPLCAEVGGDMWFSMKEDSTSSKMDSIYAKSVCRRCIHQIECAEWGIVNESFGIWGGLVEQQRRVIRRKRRITVRQKGKSA